jgi:hypothetical protein
MTKHAIKIIALLAALSFQPGCDADDGGREPGSGVADGGGDADSDGDSDGDADSDGDSDGDGDADCYENLDIVFVLDVSTTMGFILQTLENQIGDVWTKAMEIDDEPHFGLVVFVDDVTVAGAQPYPDVASIQADFHQWYTHTSSNEQTTTTKSNVDFPENSLDALHAAAGGFDWRDHHNTLRVIIHATDDTFREPPATFSGAIPAAHGYDETVDALQEAFIRVASFAAYKGGPVGNADVSLGFLADYEGKPSIPEATDGQAFDLEQVGKGTSLVDAINDFVLDEICTEYAPI